MSDLDAARQVLKQLFGPPAARSFAVRFWDGTVDAPAGHDMAFTLVLRGPGALRRMLVPPTEMSIVNAYLFGDVDVEGDMEAAASLGDLVAPRLARFGTVARLARRVLALPSEPARGPSGQPPHRWRGGLRRSHSVARDRRAVRFHYDVGNEFFALWLDRRMVYSCAYFEHDNTDLDVAQQAKLDYVCRKLRLRAGERLLYIGCGWGALILHAAQHYGVEAVGITLSERQAAVARQRIVDARLESRCKVEVRDYRELADEGLFDKVASIGMVEHVGLGQLPDYFRAAFRALKPGGLFLNHGIVSIAGARARSLGQRLAARLWRRNVFINRYVFPDAVLVPVAPVIDAAERAGFETRDLESLREHYAMTLRHWVRRLERHEREAIRLVGEVTYRAWRLYMAGSAYGFRSGRIGVLQTLFAKPDARGSTGLPLTRADLYATGQLALPASTR
ncbi:MAG: cyclopropane-fatty-acyl-phospholipid synthase family protein [Gemmatimonadota bacterium]|nr:cyclopropane-fatty-acyl-phospholipid synthase family protein [Gemmatimonadota bacterium]